MSGKPFLFDNNMFDDENLALEEEEKAQATPEFTKDELEAEIKRFYKKGKNDGFKESEESITKSTLSLLQKIDRDMAVLFAAEHDRSKAYEGEAVNLTLSIIEKLFPLYAQKYGYEELKSAITKTISENNIPAKIEIELHGDILQKLEEHIKETKNNLNKEITMITNNNLKQSECKILWPNGGIIHNHDDIAEKTFIIMKEALADSGISVHDDNQNKDEATGEA